MTDNGEAKGADPNGAAYSGVAWTLRFGGLMAIVSESRAALAWCTDFAFLGGRCDLQEGGTDQDGKGELLKSVRAVRER